MISKAVKSDKTEILALYRAQLGMPFCCWTEDYPSEEEIDFDLSRGALYIKREEGRIIAAISVDDDQNVNELSFWDSSLSPGAELARLVVDREFQNRGIALEMVAHVVGILKDQGCRSIRYLVDRTNAPALNSYRHLDASLVGECSLYGHEYYCFEKKIE